MVTNIINTKRKTQVQCAEKAIIIEFICHIVPTCVAQDL